MRPRPPLALTPEERATALEVLNAERFVDQAPLRSTPPSWTKGLPLLGTYPVPHPGPRRTPCASGVTCVAIGVPQAGAPHHRPQSARVVGHHQVAADLDLLLALRYVVGWLVAERRPPDRRDLPQAGHPPEKLTLPADRGNAMTSKKVALLLADLASSRATAAPVSDDNPTPETQFKTLKLLSRLTAALQLPAGRQGLLSGLLRLVSHPQPNPGGRPSWPTPRFKGKLPTRAPAGPSRSTHRPNPRLMLRLDR